MSNETNQGDAQIDRVLKIKRCAAVVKGGRRFSFAALVVVGDGKANEVPPSVAKAQKAAGRAMIQVPIINGTIPHKVTGRFGAAHVLLMPASPGTGIIAGQAVRSVCEALGIQDILTKSFRSNNPTVLIKATFDALSQLRTREDVERLRGVSL
jgi:small subunit ribosomal protein S5